MIVSNLLLVCGTAVLTWSLRSFGHPLLRRLGTAGLFVTSFLAGWLLGGYWWLGAIFASSWLFLPWIDIWFFARKAEFPIPPPFEKCPPPNSEDFPDLGDLTDAVEGEGFEHVVDAGWCHGGMRNFYRIFYHAEKRVEAGVCLVERSTASFYYFYAASSAEGGVHYISWNYPFSYGLLVPGRWRVQRLSGELEFPELLEAHGRFAGGAAPARGGAVPGADAAVASLLERAEEQMLYNLERGILRRRQEGFVAYSMRGLLFLWGESLKDFFRV